LELFDLFKKMIESKSQTPEDGGLLDFISQYLPDFTAKRIDVNGVKNLFLYKRFSKGTHLSFVGHVDVVPAGDGWDTEPYTLVEKDGYLYGRGTQDMKSGVSAFVQALKHIQNFNGTLSLLLTSDEEGEGIYGTSEILAYLKKNNLLPDMAIVAEPTCELIMGDAIKVGRRGSINGTLKIIGKQGHAAYPEKSINPVHILANILPKLAGHYFDDGDKFFSPSQFVITDIRGGMEVTNVTPDFVTLMFNIRNNTKTDKLIISNYIKEACKDIEYKLEFKPIVSKPFYTDTNSSLITCLDDAIYKTCKTRPKYSTAGGTSDARFISAYGIDVVEFGVKNDRIHAINERTTKEELNHLYGVFSEVIKII